MLTSVNRFHGGRHQWLFVPTTTYDLILMQTPSPSLYYTTLHCFIHDIRFSDAVLLPYLCGLSDVTCQLLFISNVFCFSSTAHLCATCLSPDFIYCFFFASYLPILANVIKF